MSSIRVIYRWGSRRQFRQRVIRTSEAKRPLGFAAFLIMVCMAAGVQAQGMSHGLEGTWAGGDCADSGSRVRIVNSFGVVDFLSIADRMHFQMLIFQDAVPVDSGTVTATLLSPTVDETLDHTFKIRDGQLDGIFVRCDEVPPTLRWAFGEMIAAFEAFGAIKTACSHSDGPDCLRTAFSFADITGDGQLTVAEVARIFRALGFLVGYASQQKAIVPAEELALPLAIASFAGPFLIEAALEGMDYDGNGALSLKELLQDRGDLAGLTAAAAAVEPAAVQAMLAAAMEVLPTLLKLLPF